MLASWCPVCNTAGMRKIILASSSPRRKEIFEKSGIHFSIEESGYKEDLTLKLKPCALAEYLALKKAERVASRHKDGLVIGADTIVVLGNKILGKPRDERDAAEILRQLSGKINIVITGIAIMDSKSGKKIPRSEETKVHFKELTDKDISEYVNTGEPIGKAGAYAVQGLGGHLIKKIDGDFWNAMGLPIDLLLKELAKFGVRGYTRTH